MSIGDDLTDDDQQGELPGDNRGNRIEMPDEEVTDSTQIPGIKEHPYQLLTPDVVIGAVESTGRHSDARILALNS